MIWDFLHNFGAGIAHSGWGEFLLVLGGAVAVWGALYFKQASDAGSEEGKSAKSKGWLFIVFAFALIVAGAIVTARVGANYVPQVGQQVQ